MSWLKLGRWVLVGLLGLTSAAACGGRGSLPYTDGEQGGESSYGGSTPIGGKGGSAGGTSVACTPGTTLCQKNAIAVCSDSGTIGAAKACAKGLTCVASKGEARCVAQICKPNKTQCDETGRTVEVCSADGTSLSTRTDCTASGQRCVAGACQATCPPNQLFCDDTGVRLCSADGTQSSSWLDCAAGESCDPQTLSCKQGFCAPGRPACNGTVATTCNALGSGFVSGGTDCSKIPDRQCVMGACSCPPKQGDCDGFARNGCETKLTDPDNCGACGAICSSNHVSNRTCDGTCNGTCEAGYRDCNGSRLRDGCEVNVATDVQHCGGCGNACSTNNIDVNCEQSVCNGLCRPNFQDCNGDKRADGCEADLRSDVKNCGSCGMACSSAHVTPQCSGGVCSGACARGFADCNLDKLSDGCETRTDNDVNNCGGCGVACASGDTCSAGKCVSLLTFTNVAQNLPIASLRGWTQCYLEPYPESQTSIEEVQKACSGSLVMLACRLRGSSTLQIAAYAPRKDVFFDTGGGGSNATHVANGVNWYHSPRYSWGFAPAGATVSRSSCDIIDSSLSGGADGDKRLCWHTQEGKIAGGWRCGRNDNLNTDGSFERLMFTAEL